VLPEPHPISRGSICGRQPAAQYKQDAGERRALGDPRPSAAAPRTAMGLRKQRLETRPTTHRPKEAVPCATVPSRPRKYKRSVRGFEKRSEDIDPIGGSYAALAAFLYFLAR
jgi:hypothetical protein